MGLGWVLQASVLVLVIAVYFALDPIRFLRYVSPPSGGVVLISGASSGIGFDLAVTLGRQQGWTVLAGVRNLSCEGAGRLNASVGGQKKNVIVVELDVTEDDQIKKAVLLAELTATVRRVPFIGVVNNAGNGHDLPVEYLTRSQIHQLYDVNVAGTMMLAAAALPHLRNAVPPGRIINVGSVGGLVSAAGLQPYVSTKAAMQSYTNSLRREVWKFGVSVSQVDPGCIATNFFGKHFFEADPSNTELSQEQRELYGYKDLITWA